MSEHSPEPWVANECGVEEFFICEAPPSGSPGEDTGWGKQIGEVDGIANARRIVACVNACRGIPTDNLEKAGALANIFRDLEWAAELSSEPEPWKCCPSCKAEIASSHKRWCDIGKLLAGVEVKNEPT